MSVARSLERRLERLIEGVAGRVFSGRLHPSELAGKLAREADFARFEHPTGPATANYFVIQVNPGDLSVDPEHLERILAAEMTAYTAEEGLRVEGPVQVSIQTSVETAPGRINCHVEVLPGPPVVWARLTSRTESVDVGRNRAFLGRSPEGDVVIPHDKVSRRHALIYREKGETWLRDLSSANGTSIDGVRLGSDAHRLEHGSVIGLADHRYRFVEI
ncbi:MAG TPA: FhaA domain-containing protein [Acidimicrobiia bacterium]